MRHDAQPLAPEMSGHLPAGAVGIFLPGEKGQHQFPHRHADGKHEGVIPVIGQKPVALTIQRERRRDLRRFLQQPGNVKIDLAGPLEQKRPFVVTAGKQHVFIHRENLFVVQTEFTVPECPPDDARLPHEGPSWHGDFITRS